MYQQRTAGKGGTTLDPNELRESMASYRPRGSLLLLAIVVPSALVPVMRPSNLSLPKALSTEK